MTVVAMTCLKMCWMLRCFESMFPLKRWNLKPQPKRNEDLEKVQICNIKSQPAMHDAILSKIWSPEMMIVTNAP